jgi:CDP-6-deoxy-D-xylo-4-hexulose-3-dehydrase
VWGLKRAANFNIYQREIKNDYWKVKPQKDSFISNFAYPVIHPNRDKIVKKLQENNIEVRPMICGSMGTQPFYIKEYCKLEFPNVSVIDKFGFYVPNHPQLTQKELDKIIDIVNGGINV